VERQEEVSVSIRFIKKSLTNGINIWYRKWYFKNLRDRRIQYQYAGRLQLFQRGNLNEVTGSSTYGR